MAYHCVRDVVAQNKAVLSYKITRQMIAYALAKALHRVEFEVTVRLAGLPRQRVLTVNLSMKSGANVGEKMLVFTNI